MERCFGEWRSRPRRRPQRRPQVLQGQPVAPAAAPTPHRRVDGAHPAQQATRPVPPPASGEGQPRPPRPPMPPATSDLPSVRLAAGADRRSHSRRHRPALRGEHAPSPATRGGLRPWPGSPLVPWRPGPADLPATPAVAAGSAAARRRAARAPPRDRGPIGPEFHGRRPLPPDAIPIQCRSARRPPTGPTTVYCRDIRRQSWGLP